MSDTAVYTTFYPSVGAFFPDFIRGIEAQTDRNFDLCIGLDGATPADIAGILKKEPTARWVRPEGRTTPARVRRIALHELVDAGYKQVILIDADDIPLPNRVAAAKTALLRADVSACGMEIVDAKAGKTGLRFIPVHHDGDLLHANVFGFSNSCYRAEILKTCLDIPDECVLVDWFVVTQAWMQGARLDVDDHIHLLYRQYGANTAQVTAPFTAAAVLRATELVLAHYRLVLSHLPTGRPDLKDAYLDIQKEKGKFAVKLSGDFRRMRAYLDALNKRANTNRWWDCVAHPELEELWKN